MGRRLIAGRAKRNQHVCVGREEAKPYPAEIRVPAGCGLRPFPPYVFVLEHAASFIADNRHSIHSPQRRTSMFIVAAELTVEPSNHDQFLPHVRVAP
jgi:hypothetical protein